MEYISVFDIIKIGIGPSSSHTMGPWLAAARAVEDVDHSLGLAAVAGVTVDLYGSLAKTGRGHGTDLAVVMGLCGLDFKTVDVRTLPSRFHAVRTKQHLDLGGTQRIPFVLGEHLRFQREEVLDFHPNGMRITFNMADGGTLAKTYYSIGGGFVIEDGETTVEDVRSPFPYPIHEPKELLHYCRTLECSIADVVMMNERSFQSVDEIHAQLDAIWEAMVYCVYKGCHTEGVLPGGLEVKRRAPGLNQKLLGSAVPEGKAAWLASIQAQHQSFQSILKWVSFFAIAANEENAAFGRVVTAPTNGASGVIPAVLFYYTNFCEDVVPDVRRFLLVAGEIGSLFKKGATISAALGGCQAEIGVSSAMAAAALTECLGGTPAQALMAAEIAMEHHLGLTCDPIGGLVQIPCIERNSMGAIKAITATNIALESDPATAKVSLDAVIRSMWDTAQDMNSKYKETSEGGLAIHIPVSVIEC